MHYSYFEYFTQKGVSKTLPATFKASSVWLKTDPAFFDKNCGALQAVSNTPERPLDAADYESL